MPFLPTSPQPREVSWPGRGMLLWLDTAQPPPSPAGTAAPRTRVASEVGKGAGRLRGRTILQLALGTSSLTLGGVEDVMEPVGACRGLQTLSIIV